MYYTSIKFFKVVYQDFSAKLKVSAILSFSDFRCPTEFSTSTTAFRNVNGKCYYITREGCGGEALEGCTFYQAEYICKTAFGPGINGIVFEPTSLENNIAVIQATNSAMQTRNGYYWIGVSNGELKYKSDGKAVSIATIPWGPGEPYLSSSQTQCLLADSTDFKWHAIRKCSERLGYIICESRF